MQSAEVKVMSPREFRAEGEKHQPGAASQSPSCATECDQSPGHGGVSQSSSSAVMALDQGPHNPSYLFPHLWEGPLCTAAPQILLVTSHQLICLLGPVKGRQHWEVSSLELA